MGQPRLYRQDPDVLRLIETHVRAGRSYAAAIEVAGVSRTTWRRWRRWAREGDRELAPVMRRLDEAKNTARREKRHRWSFDRLLSTIQREYAASLAAESAEEEDDSDVDAELDGRSAFRDFLGPDLFSDDEDDPLG